MIKLSKKLIAERFMRITKDDYYSNGHWGIHETHIRGSHHIGAPEHTMDQFRPDGRRLEQFKDTGVRVTSEGNTLLVILADEKYRTIIMVNEAYWRPLDREFNSAWGSDGVNPLYFSDDGVPISSMPPAMVMPARMDPNTERVLEALGRALQR